MFKFIGSILDMIVFGILAFVVIGTLLSLVAVITVIEELFKLINRILKRIKIWKIGKMI